MAGNTVNLRGFRHTDSPQRCTMWIPVELCYLGWQESLALLAQLVEQEIRQ